MGLILVLNAAPVWAQLAVTPHDLSVSVPQHATETRTVTLTNAGSETLSFCVSFERSLQRTEGAMRLAGGSEPCGDYGEVLYRLDDDDVSELGWDPHGITMTPEGRLFTSSSSALHRTFELTPDLQLLRFFENPHVAELTPFSGTAGITFDPESGTLWWMNSEREPEGSQIVTRRVLLLEGDLDGVETGRRIEIAPPDAPLEGFHPGGLSYDEATDLFYTRGILGNRNDAANWQLWAVDREGTVPEGYPLRPEPYPPPATIGRPDVHGGAEGGAEGVRVEFAVNSAENPLGYDRVVVTDRWGSDEGTELETPVPAALFEASGAGIRGNPLRSRVDPNGVMYMTFVNFDDAGIVGVRPHPLPPSWLFVDSDAGPEAAWDGELAPGEGVEVVLTFRTGAREVGDYTASLQAFEAASGEVVEVPLVLTVTEGTDVEEGAESEASALAVYPNPSFGDATVALTLGAASDVRVAVYDVLGRRVALLAEGRLAAGTHRLSLGGRALPTGVYLVRATGDGLALTERITLLR